MASIQSRLARSEAGLGHLAQLREWLELQPEPERSELATMLDGSAVGFYSAELELAVGALLSTQGFDFERHPTLPLTERRPDYLANRRDLDVPIIVGARSSIDERAMLRDEAFEDLYDELEQIEGPEVVSLTVEGTFTSATSVQAAARAIERRIKELRRAPSGEPVVAFSDERCSLLIDVIHTDADETGEPKVGWLWSFGSSARTLDTVPALRRTVSRKLSRYGQMSVPYVIAVFAQREFPLLGHSVAAAFYGNQSVRFDPNDRSGPPTVTRVRNGIFTATDAAGIPVRTRLSGCLLLDRRYDDESSAPRAEFAFLQNPFATHALPGGTFGDTPSFEADRERRDDFTMTWKPSVPAWW